MRHDPSPPLPDAPAAPRALWLIIVAFVVLSAVYSVITPAFETPDEIWHYAFVQHLATGQGLPVSAAGTQALWQQQGVQAPGYYLAAAALTAWIDQSDFPAVYARANPHRAIGRPDAEANRNYLIHHRDEQWPWRGSILALHVARLFSVLLGAVTLWASYQAAARVVTPRQALAGVAVFAFIPQFIFISAAASNDNAVNALAALTLWRLVVLVNPGGARAEAGLQGRALNRCFLLLGVLLGLAALSKLSALGLFGLAGLAVLFLAWRQRSLRPIFAAAMWIGVPAAAIAGWWYVRNWLLYADPLAWNVWQANILLRVEPAGWKVIAAELTSLERSFWGLFGWLNAPYPDLVYQFFRGLELLLAGGWLLALGRWAVRDRHTHARGDKRVDARWASGLLLLLWLAILAVSWLRFMHIAPAAQGRYFFPAAPALVMLIAVGLHGWGVWTLGWLVAGLLFLLSAFTPWWIIQPAYQPPPSLPLAADALAPVNARLGEHFTIISVDASPDELLPGEQATVRVAWRVDQPPPVDYSVFVHLVDADGLIAAQHDTMPGGGLYPTSQWQPGESRVEAYPVTLPHTAFTPNHGRWAVGLYDAATGHRLPVTLDMPPEGNAADAEAVDNALRFGAVAIIPAPGEVPNRLDVAFRDNVTLAGYTLNHRRLAPGDELEVTLYWQARGPVTGDYTAFVHLLDQAHAMHGGHDHVPAVPSTQWDDAGVITDTHRFAVAESAAPGVYQLEIGLYTRPGFDRLQVVEADGAEGADRLLLGPLEVTAR